MNQVAVRSRQGLRTEHVRGGLAPGGSSGAAAAAASLPHLGPLQQLLLAEDPQLVQQPRPQAAGARRAPRPQLRRQAAGGQGGAGRGVGARCGSGCKRRPAAAAAAAVHRQRSAWPAPAAAGGGGSKPTIRHAHDPADPHSTQWRRAPKVCQRMGGRLQRLLREAAHEGRHQRGDCGAGRAAGRHARDWRRQQDRAMLHSSSPPAPAASIAPPHMLPRPASARRSARRRARGQRSVPSAPEQPVAVICCSSGTPLATRSTRAPSVTRSSAPLMATTQPCAAASALPASSASACVVTRRAGGRAAERAARGGATPERRAIVASAPAVNTAALLLRSAHAAAGPGHVGTPPQGQAPHPWRRRWSRRPWWPRPPPPPAPGSQTRCRAPPWA